MLQDHASALSYWRPGWCQGMKHIQEGIQYPVVKRSWVKSGGLNHYNFMGHFNSKPQKKKEHQPTRA